MVLICFSYLLHIASDDSNLNHYPEEEVWNLHFIFKVFKVLFVLICWVCPSLFSLPTNRVKILVAEFREMFPGDHAKPSTEALYKGWLAIVILWHVDYTDDDGNDDHAKPSTEALLCDYDVHIDHGVDYVADDDDADDDGYHEIDHDYVGGAND